MGVGQSSAYCVESIACGLGLGGEGGTVNFTLRKWGFVLYALGAQ